MVWNVDLSEEYGKKLTECSELLTLIELQDLAPIDYEIFLARYKHIIDEEPPFAKSVKEDQIQRLITLDWIADGLRQRIER